MREDAKCGDVTEIPYLELLQIIIVGENDMRNMAEIIAINGNSVCVDHYHDNKYVLSIRQANGTCMRGEFSTDPPTTELAGFLLQRALP